MDSYVFDYKLTGKNRHIPQTVLDAFEIEAAKEFPSDKMLMEIHILRAINNYAKNRNTVQNYETMHIS